MAITDIIEESSMIETGAPSIKYEGERPLKKPEMLMAGPDWYTKRMELLMDEYGYDYDEAGEIAYDSDKYYEVIGIDPEARNMDQGIPNTKTIKDQPHMLAYITPNEVDKLKALGGQETMTPEGIPAYPEFDNYSGPNTPGGAMSRSDFESGAYSGTGNAGDGVIQQYNTPQAPPKKPPKTKDNYKKPNKFVTPTKAVLGYIGNQFKNSKLGMAMNTKAREDYLENLKETNPEAYAETVNDLAKLGYAKRDVEIYGPKGKRDGPMAPGRDIETFTDLSEDQAKAILGQDYQDYLDDRNKTPTGDGGGEQDPCKGPNPPAYCFVGGKNQTDEEEVVEEDWYMPLAFRAEGGRVGRAFGGMMGDDGRRAYGLGSIFKKITKPLKKVFKSPLGKMAILGGLGMLTGGAGPSSFMGKLKANSFLKSMLLKGGEGAWSMGNISPWKAIGLASSLSGLMAAKDYKKYDDWGDNDDGTGLGDLDQYRNYYNQPLAFRAEGGRVGAQEGGLMDMGGMEKDYREEGGFVPIGGEEKADDVPARLSKNEFVFTADAVRGAGEGDIDKGAEVMYNMMKNLEAGGEVSEESQGLDGAREMFQTSQRLEEVL